MSKDNGSRSGWSRPFDLALYHWRRLEWHWYLPRLVSDYEDVIIDRPIFLLGNQGDGLTLISRMLRRHRDVVSITGDSRYWIGADEIQNVMASRLPESLRLPKTVAAGAPRHPRLTPPPSWSYGTDDLFDAYRATGEDRTEEAERKLRKVIREAVVRHGRRGSARFVDKSQLFTIKIPLVESLLEGSDPFFVLITRNPYAACVRAASGRAGDMRRYASFMDMEERVRLCAQHWSNTTACALEDGAKARHFISMRFEDFLLRPEASLRSLCSFVDLEFSGDMVPAPAHTIPMGSRYPERWYPIRRDVNARYLAESSVEHRQIIDQRCGELAERLGYGPEGTSEGIDG